jgi:hypothetical protein
MSADTFHKFALCRSLLLGAFCVAHAGVASADMATVGSVGIVDPKDAGEIATDDVSATLSFAQPGQHEATIRYPVTLVPVPNVPGLNSSTLWSLTVRYQDGDPTPAAQTQRILVHLKELELSTGQVTTVVSFDSDVLHPADVVTDWQLKTVSACHRFSPAAAFFLEAILTSSATPLAPAVRLGGMVVAPELVNDFQCPS